MRVVALVDGEHYPSVTRWALASATAGGFYVLAALVVGGIEKLDRDGHLDLGPVPVRRVDAVRPSEEVEPATDLMAALGRAIDELRPDGILDLSDEPVMGYRRRMELAAVALARGVPYLGPDFRFEPPIREAPLSVPTVAVVGTGKRVAKTAVAGHLARLASAAGHRPWIVAMGRGGPSGPVEAGPQDVTVDALLARVERGEHAASDYLEDALTSGVPTVGARRAGGGLAGRPFVTNVDAAARTAAASGAGLVILEGSGSSMPTVPWDAGILVAPSTIPHEYLVGYFGPLRLLLSDLLVVILAAGPSTGPDNLSKLTPHIRRLRADLRVAVAVLQPVPLADVRGRVGFFATTARGDVAGRLAEQLERTSGCRIVKVSARLADREGLEADIASAPDFDVMLTELKAAAVDVAARRAVERGADVVFVDNRPVAVADHPAGDGAVDDLLRETADLAVRRGRERMGST